MAKTKHQYSQRAKIECQRKEHSLNEKLQQKCKGKVNHLQPCNRCKIKHHDWPVLHNMFEADLLNTGSNGQGNAVPSGSGHDLQWETALGAPGGPPPTTGWSKAYVYQFTSWTSSPFGNANWISPYKNAHHSGDIDVYFRIRFYLSSEIDLTSFYLNLKLYSDNSIHEIYVNGQAQSGSMMELPQDAGSPYQHPGYKSGDLLELRLASDFKSCENEIIIQVKSGATKVGLLAQLGEKCREATLPHLTPEIKIKWGRKKQKCISSNCKTICITVCNRYNNLTLSNFKINHIQICDQSGKPIPDQYIEAVPMGGICFGDIPPCTCISREATILIHKKIPGTYRLKIAGICYDVCLSYSEEVCYDLELCGREASPE